MPADVIGVLGQAAPGAAADAACYTVPNDRTAVLSGLFVCNTGAATTYRVHHRVNAAAVGVGNAVCYDVAIDANTTDPILAGLALGDNDVLSVRSASGLVTFTACGEETDEPV